VSSATLAPISRHSAAGPDLRMACHLARCQSSLRLNTAVRLAVWFLFALWSPSLALAAPEGQACTPEPTVMSIAYGDVVVCSFETLGDTDSFRFSGNAGETAYIAATRPDLGDLCYQVFDPTGARIGGLCGNASHAVVRISSTGTYTILVQDYDDNERVPYAVAVERVGAPPSGQRLDFGSGATDEINPAADIDAYSFYGIPGDRVIASAARNDRGDMCLEVFDSAGVSIGGQCGHPVRGDVRLTQAGFHTIVIQDYQNNQIASYRVDLQCIGACPPAPGQGLPSVPGAPTNFRAAVSGSAVTFSWTAAVPGGVPSSYIVEAGRFSGASDITVFDTASAATSLTVASVPAGTYFVRMRARNVAGTSGPSNEVTVVVGGSPCTIPGAPTLALTSFISGSVALTWTTPTGGATTYVIEAGSSAGLTNLANSDLGSAATTLFASGLGAGPYFVRVRARNACGLGPPSNEIVLSATTPAPPPPTSNNLLVNPSFETACTSPATYVAIFPGNTCLTGWTIVGADIHLTGGTYWQAAEGRHSLDLDGNVGSAGGVAQTLSTVPGAEYVVTFDLAGNPENAPIVKMMRVSADGQFADFAFNVTGRSVRNMGWTRQTWSFIADDSTATLEFRSLDSVRGWGPALDNVSVVRR
jgi:choice-of-anchor C domain-containing protein